MPQFSNYLFTQLSTFSQLLPLTPLDPQTPPHLVLNTSSIVSPAKRPRPSSPSSSSEDYSNSSSFSSSGTDFSSSSSAPIPFCSSPTAVPSSPLSSFIPTSCLRNPQSLCTSRSHTPSSSPPSSRPLSRTHSVKSTYSTKSVRFARCTNASVFPALSGEEYDRTPIEVTSEGESLNLPKRCGSGEEGDEMGGWIMCVERERKKAAAAAKEAAAAAASTSTEVENTAPVCGSPGRVEGFRGMINGGYFVGDERDERIDSPVPVSDDDCADDGDDDELPVGDDMVVDDEEDGTSDVDDETVPSLVENATDDSASEDSSLSSPPPPAQIVVVEFESSSKLSGFSSPSPSPSPPLPSSTFDRDFIASPVEHSSSTNSLTGLSRPTLNLTLSSSTITQATVDQQSSSAITTTTTTVVASGTPEEMAEKKKKAEEERKRKCKERYGICALGKYSRAEVFQSYDSLGGF